MISPRFVVHPDDNCASRSLLDATAKVNANRAGGTWPSALCGRKWLCPARQGFNHSPCVWSHQTCRPSSSPGTAYGTASLGHCPLWRGSPGSFGWGVKARPKGRAIGDAIGIPCRAPDTTKSRKAANFANLGRNPTQAIPAQQHSALPKKQRAQSVGLLLN